MLKGSYCGYGCTNSGGGGAAAIIIGILGGLCCICILCYCVATFCTGKRRESKKTCFRRKSSGHIGEMKNEPIVIHAEEGD